MGKTQRQNGRSGTQKPGRPSRKSAGGIAWRKGFLRRRGAKRRRKATTGSGRCIEVEIQRPNFSRRCDQWISCTGRIRTKGNECETSGEQVDSADRADRWRQRRWPPGERPGCWERRKQDFRGVGKSARASELVDKRGYGVLTLGKRPFLIKRFKFFPSADVR